MVINSKSDLDKIRKIEYTAKAYGWNVVICNCKAVIYIACTMYIHIRVNIQYIFISVTIRKSTLEICLKLLQYIGL